ncbi:hypothetical protein [Mesorhizobium sp. KR9-304]|uniref:hypothetical protein n=1 Tax=Mesorhizobium sp. KR9-304 TaxID=3156614 RepID=UPI0032B5DED3
MKLPSQAKPVARQLSKALDRSAALSPSDCCGAGRCCVGACLPFGGGCAGVCVPNIGQC